MEALKHPASQQDQLDEEKMLATDQHIPELCQNTISINQSRGALEQQGIPLYLKINGSTLENELIHPPENPRPLVKVQATDDQDLSTLPG